ncbi:unnamed protein product [Rhizoctonia solani]|uniref:FAD-binding PCMH-type domain-containing protein n=1 Tax=Rhizoctonia solani TaxID=456999 RepID=A0A8H3AZQ9_9AGAM|nr:unnamed protein product [Rhizoctonia solani]
MMARGFTLAQRFSMLALLAVAAHGASETCCNQLAKALAGGKVLQSSDSNYTAENQKHWSLTSILTPACILLPESSSDVSTAVKILVKNSCKFAVRGGGHTTNPGWANTNSGVLISLSKLVNVEVSEDNKSVYVGAGNRWGDVYSKTGERGVTVTGGRLSSVGVSGFLLGGGLSFLMHSKGFGADNVLSYEIVLANGAISTVTKESSQDLFKALKGGSGNFGIVTSFKLQTYPINDVYAGNLQYSPDQYNTLFSLMETYARKGIESDPKTHIISNFIYYPSQSIEAANFYSFYPEPITAPPPATKPFFDVPTISNTVKVKTMKEALDELSVGSEVKQRYDFRAYTVRADAKLFKKLFDTWHSTTKKLNGTSGWASTIVYQVISNSMIHASNMKGGNVLGLEPAPNPRIIVSYLFAWSLEEDDKKVHAAIDKLITDSKDIAKSQGRLDRYIYLNYAGSNQQPIQSYGPTQVNFLRNVKSKYDPNNVFEKLSCGGFKIPT